ncbi:hypothetical protein V2I01_16510 [Micromonospora sp. BRA006-A]|nr:hypothetical protein [Micromonospora sp. BRA006-A]
MPIGKVRPPRSRRYGDRAGAGQEATPSRFRADVAGLRAVAVGLVLLYHAGLPFIPGGFVGVDVFFVISGFLITGQLISEIERSGRVARRLLRAPGQAHPARRNRGAGGHRRRGPAVRTPK